MTFFFSESGQLWGSSIKMKLAIEKGFPLSYLQLGFQIRTWHTEMLGQQPVKLEDWAYISLPVSPPAVKFAYCSFNNFLLRVYIRTYEERESCFTVPRFFFSISTYNTDKTCDFSTFEWLLKFGSQMPFKVFWCKRLDCEHVMLLEWRDIYIANCL